MADFIKAKKIAEEVLRENYITEPPVPVVEVVKNYGYEVREIELPPNVAGFVNAKDHIIFINIIDSETRKAFTVAHELGHIKLHSVELDKNPEIGILYRRPLGKKDQDEREQEANYFAASLLVPKSMYENILEKYNELLNENNKTELLSKLFSVSKEVIKYRLHDFDLER